MTSRTPRCSVLCPSCRMDALLDWYEALASNWRCDDGPPSGHPAATRRRKERER